MLDKSVLVDEFRNIFSADKDPKPESESHCATLLAGAIVKYLAGLEIMPIAAPGINPVGSGGGPLPDPAFIPGIALTPTISPRANISIIESGFRASMIANTAGTKVWQPANAALAAYVIATYTTFSASGYTAVGATVPGPVAVDSVLNILYDSSQDAAENLATHLHTFFTASVFTGAYSKNLFVGVSPHVSNFR